MQLLFSEDSNSDRGFDIDFKNGSNSKVEIFNDYDTNPNSSSTANPEVASYVNHQFKAEGTSAILILDGDGWSGADKNPIISGMSVETLSNGSSLALSSLTITADQVTTNGNIYSNGAVTINNASATTISDIIIDGQTSAASLVKGGSGKLTLSGSNTYTNNTTINSGTLSISADSNLGTAPGSADADNIIFDGGTLETTASFTLNTNRGITLTGNGTIDVDSGTTLAYAGIIASSGDLDKTDSGTLTLSGTNTYTGATTISAGIIAISDAVGLGT
ncbi:autotransporter-associated beta strand repeat-containing protein, partial [Candidatus Pelagibacter sp. HIMB1623]|uniref:autotransporter-associated beta strand repeat-containing protein n=1 Tax=Candidatus Pelagibacter sp. HIMB1623 TaxID=3413358 RepID=UPI003F84BD83